MGKKLSNVQERFSDLLPEVSCLLNSGPTTKPNILPLPQAPVWKSKQPMSVTKGIGAEMAGPEALSQLKPKPDEAQPQSWAWAMGEGRWASFLHQTTVHVLPFLPPTPSPS